MKNVAPYSKNIVYADDTTVIVSGKTATEAAQKANDILDRYYNYFTVNKLTINEGKTKYMVFNNNYIRKKSKHHNAYNLVMNNVTIEQVKSIKFLGVYINDKLNWNEHKEYIRIKISRNLGILYKCRNIFTKEDIITMYNCFVLPYLLYCVPLWGGSVQGENDIIIKIQNKVIRILFNAKRSDDGWCEVKNRLLPFKELYKVEMAKFCFKHVNNTLPEHFSANVMPTFATSIHNVHTRHSSHLNYLVEASLYTPLASRSFTTQCTKVWNAIPNLLKTQSNIVNTPTGKFSNSIKNYYLWTLNNTSVNITYPMHTVFSTSTQNTIDTDQDNNPSKRSRNML